MQRMARKVQVKRTLKRGLGGYADEEAMAEAIADLLPEFPVVHVPLDPDRPSKTIAAHVATFEQLRERVPQVVRLTKKDRKPILSRSGEQMWQQIIRNIKAHKRDGFIHSVTGALAIPQRA